MKRSWKSLSVPHKVCTVVSYIIFAIGVVGLLAPRMGYELPFNLFYAALSAYSVCEAILSWKSNRKFAILDIVAAVVFAVLTVIDILK